MERKPRIDSLRNRELLVGAAKAAFTEAGVTVALEEIARRAGVGIGTLYRNFPTRDALVAAVYRRELGQLCDAADTLLAERRPDDALETWLHLLLDYMATKRVVGPVLRADPGEGMRLYESSGAALTGALDRLVHAAREAGRIRADIGEGDIFRLLVGMSYGYETPGWENSARRLVGVVMAGLRSVG